MQLNREQIAEIKALDIERHCSTNIECWSCGSKKLGVKNNVNLYLYNCFKCGISGCVRLDYLDVVQEQRNSASSSTKSEGAINRIRSIQRRSVSCPARACAWFERYGISALTADMHSICYDPDEDRVVIPCIRHGEWLGCTSRRLGTYGPKYITRRSTAPLWSIYGSGTTLVVTEDALSAIKLSALPEVTALSLWGVNLCDSALSKSQEFNDVVVWLDNDNPKVRQCQRILTNQLQVCSTVRVMRTDQDPKELSLTELRERLNA